MKKHLTESERTALKLIQGADSYILITDDGSGEYRIHQKMAERDRFIFVYEPDASGKVKLHAYGYPNEKLIANRLVVLLKDMFQQHNGLPLTGKKLILGPDGRIVVDESADTV